VILDTDHMSLLEWTGSPQAQNLESRLNHLAAEEIATTDINYEEQLRGWMTVLAKGPKLKDQIDIYGRLRSQLRIFCGLTIFTFDENAAVEFARLKKEYPRLGTMELKIAAIVLSQDGTLLSRNRRDFGRIAGLKLEDLTT
jgi:tRNA(fMet)-specific endonuclease VapC